MAPPIPPLIFPRTRSERKPAQSGSPLIFPSPAKATPQRRATDLTAITPIGQRRQSTDNDTRTFHQPEDDDSHANGKAIVKKNDLNPEEKQSNHRKRKKAGAESASMQAKRVRRESNRFIGRLESFAQDDRGVLCDDENKSSTLLGQDEAIDSFEGKQPQRLQRPVSGEGDGLLECIAVSRQSPAGTKNDPRTCRRSRQSSPHVTADSVRSESTSRMRSPHSRGSLGGGTGSPPVRSQRDWRKGSPSRATLNEFKATDLEDMVKREVQRQLAEVETGMLSEIDRKFENVLRYPRDAQMNESREGNAALKEKRRGQE